MTENFRVFNLGLIDFQTAWGFQKHIFSRVKKGQLNFCLILCRHPAVITLGRKASRDNIKASAFELKKLNIPLFEIERGGDVTYHGPGQLCVYPIINLAYFKKDINWYLRSLETLLLEALSAFAINAHTLPGSTGIWVGGQKIASIGIAIKNWITFHGASLNVKNNDAANFSLIRPCGLDIMMTSMEGILGEKVRFKEVEEVLTRSCYERSNFTAIGRRH